MAIVDIDRSHGSGASGRVMTRKAAKPWNACLMPGSRCSRSTACVAPGSTRSRKRRGLSKTNLLYYVGTKDELYRAVLERTLAMWLEPLKALDAASDPKQAITSYIERKLEYSRDYPQASRLFALEIMSGAEALRGLLDTDLRSLVEAKAAIMRRWMDQRRMKRIDPVQFIFMVWGAHATSRRFCRPDRSGRRTRSFRARVLRRDAGGNRRTADGGAVLSPTISRSCRQWS